MIKSSLVAGAGGISRVGGTTSGPQLAATTRLRARLPAARDVFKSWRAHEITLQPFGDGWWSFNPSIHRDPQGVVRCVYRVANYTLPGGVPRLSGTARAGRCETRNVLAIMDPDTLLPVRAAEVAELDDLPRVPTCASVGYEDVRLFWTRAGGLRGIATALQFNAAHPRAPGDGDVRDPERLRDRRHGAAPRPVVVPAAEELVPVRRRRTPRASCTRSSAASR